MLFVLYDFWVDNSIVNLKFLIVCFLIFLIPTLVIHLQYYVENKSIAMLIDKNQIRIIVNRKEQFTFHIQDISLIELCLSPAQYFKSSFLNTPFDTYYYAKIKLKTGKSFVITSLLIDKQETLEFKGVKIIRHKIFFPIIE